MRLRKVIFVLALLVLLYSAYVAYVFTRQIGENPVISAGAAVDFGITAEEMRDYQLVKLYPYPGTSFVFCWFLRGSMMFSDDGEGEYWSIASVVDLENKQSLLRVRAHCVGRSMIHIGVGSFFHSSDSVNLNPYVSPNNRPVITIRRFSNAGLVPHDYRRAKDNYYWLHLDGSEERAPMEQFPGFVPIQIYSHISRLPIGVSNRFVITNPIESLFEEYEYTGKGMKKIRNWDYILPSALKFYLEDGTYCGFISHRQEIVFYRPTEPPTLRVIPYASAAHLLPGDEPSSIIESSFLENLSQPIGKSTVFFCSTRRKPGYPVYEIKTEHIDAGTPDEIFQLIGNNYPTPPEHISNGQDFLYSGDSFFRREVNADGSLGMFSNQPEAMKWGPGKRVWAEVQPYADRLLYYRDGGIWTSGLDGSGEERVFPGE